MRWRAGEMNVSAWLARLFFVVPFLLSAQLAAAQSPAAHEAGLKAAFLFNFFRFVEWPEAALPPGGTLQLCMLDRSSLEASAFDAMNGRSVNGHPLQVRWLPGSGDLSGCHMAYAGEGAARALLAARVASQPVLLVSDAEGFAAQGGGIGLLARDGRLRFEINLDAARRANLRVSAQLLKLAVSVREAEGK